jgi:hypothetical protein
VEAAGAQEQGGEGGGLGASRLLRLHEISARITPTRIRLPWIAPRGQLRFSLKRKNQLPRPPNYKQEKKRREEQQKKKNEEKQREIAERRKPPADPQPP